ncbi:MAG TPA: ABC transporter substrate-binding protein [Anaerovoracaceae bacterium]|nr:ABC transporter substrate-binding protein [Anaerovoracaceae bacterium]
MKRRISLLVCIIMILSLVFTGCGGGGTTEEPSGDTGDAAAETVKLGAVYPLSGANALLGEESLRGAQLAVDEVNKAGGLWGKQIELVIADAPDVTAGQTEAERLITKEGMPLLFGAYSSALANVVSDVCARYEIPYFELGGIGSDIMNKGYPYLWRTCSDATAFGQGQANFYDQAVLPKLGIDKASSKIVVAHEDSLFGTSVGEAAIEQFKSLGYSEANIKEIPYAATSVDLSSVIMDAKSFNPDAFLAISYVSDAILMGRQAQELNFQPKVWIGGGAGWAMKDTQEGIGKGIYGIYDVDWPQYAMNKDNAKGLDEYIAYYKETYGQDPRSGHSLGEYVGAQMMLEVLEKAGSLDKDAIKEAAASMDKPVGTYTGGWGVKFDERGQNINAPAVMFMWTQEQLVAVWPEQYAVTDAVVPMPTWAEKEAL